MSDDQTIDLLRGLDIGDLNLDARGRVVIVNPELVQRLKATGAIGTLRPAARDDTNVICCGNKSCAADLDLGSLVERFTSGGEI